MVLVACKKCGKEVHEDVKKCTKCGAKMPNDNTVETWFFFIFLFVFVYFIFQLPKPITESKTTKVDLTNSEKTDHSLSNKLTPPTKPAWSTSEFSDRMTGELSAYASSPISFPTETMAFPYGNVSAWLGVGCNKHSEWVYVKFNSAPNLANTETKDGYNQIFTRIKWDNTIDRLHMRQSWGARAIHFDDRVYDDGYIIEKIASSNTALLELQWHGQQSNYFEFSLNGSSKALKKIRSRCKAG